MANIRGIENMTIDQVNQELEKGAKFVVFTYVISLILMSFKRGSDIYFVKSDESTIKKGWPFLLISFFLGWWGIPWGPIYSFQSMYYAFSGKDVTNEVMNSLAVNRVPVSNTGYNINNNSSDPYQINNN